MESFLIRPVCESAHKRMSRDQPRKRADDFDQIKIIFSPQGHLITRNAVATETVPDRLLTEIRASRGVCYPRCISNNLPGDRFIFRAYVLL